MRSLQRRLRGLAPEDRFLNGLLLLIALVIVPTVALAIDQGALEIRRDLRAAQGGYVRYDRCRKDSAHMLCRLHRMLPACA